MPPPTPEEVAARRAAKQAAEQNAAAVAQAVAQNATAAEAAQYAANRLATEQAAIRVAEEAVRLRLERSLLAQEPMEVDQSLVFPLPQGSVAQVDFGQSWKALTGYFDGNPKTVTEVSNLVRNFEQCITSGNWTQHMAMNN